MAQRATLQSVPLPWRCLGGRGLAQLRSIAISRYLAHGCRRYSTSASSKEKPYYVTSPIFYVNAAPHVGHLYSMIIPDILKRWQQVKGRKAIYCTGTDEHGMKIQRAAERAGEDPQTFVDNEAAAFKALAERAGIANDHFIRTTDPDHKDAVRYAWQMLEDAGHIYLSKHEGWYSVSDETYYPQSAVHLVVDAPTGRKMMASMETGKEVEWTSETNYKFRLSAFRDRLLTFYEENPTFVIPQTRMNDVINAVRQGLEDLSVSRPTSRLSWGIRVPTDESQTIYVWLDALINYITKAGYPWPPGKETAKGWPADCQVIGKEIVRFHCIYWPAFLMALNLPPPKRILTHAHWTLGKEKMSKSTGNVVNPFFALDRFGAEVMRFFLAHDGHTLHDSDYDNSRIIERYKKALQGGLGNLATRVSRGKGWNVHEAVKSSRGETNPGDWAQNQVKILSEVTDRFAEEMERYNIRAALTKVLGMIYETNSFLQQVEPWRLLKSNDAESQRRVTFTIYLCAEACRIAGILMQPYMPNKMSQLLDMFGVRTDRRDFAHAGFGADDDYGKPMIDLGRGFEGALFPPLMSAY